MNIYTLPEVGTKKEYSPDGISLMFSEPELPIYLPFPQYFDLSSLLGTSTHSACSVKKGDQFSTLKLYLPFALKPFLSKVFEFIFNRKIGKHVSCFNLFLDRKHDFLKKSTNEGHPSLLSDS